jgi:hypothetical protein
MWLVYNLRGLSGVMTAGTGWLGCYTTCPRTRLSLEVFYRACMRDAAVPRRQPAPLLSLPLGHCPSHLSFQYFFITKIYLMKNHSIYSCGSPSQQFSWTHHNRTYFIKPFIYVNVHQNLSWTHGESFLQPVSSCIVWNHLNLNKCIIAHWSIML